MGPRKLVNMGHGNRPKRIVKEWSVWYVASNDHGNRRVDMAGFAARARGCGMDPGRGVRPAARRPPDSGWSKGRPGWIDPSLVQAALLPRKKGSSADWPDRVDILEVEVEEAQ